MDYLRTRMETKKSMLTLIVIFTLIVPTVVGFGFDSGSSCTNEKTARRGRAQLLKSIPCDLSVQAYCNLPGTMYPWHAVRRFVNENQGMMKRMYGDVRHISVLRNEINNNDITLEDVEETAVRYSRAGWKRNKYLYQESAKAKNSDLLSESHYRRASTARSTTGRSTPRTRSRTTQKPSSTSASTVETSAQSSTLSSSTEPTTTKKVKPTERRVSIAKLTRNPEDSNEKSNDDPYEEVIEAAIEEIFDQFDSENANTANKNVFSNVSDTEKMPSELRNEPNDNIEIVGAPDLSDKTNKSEVAATISTTLRIYGYTKEERTTIAAPLNTTTENVMAENRTESLLLIENGTTPTSQADENLIHFEVDSSDLDPVSVMIDEDSTPAESINAETIVDGNGIAKPDKNTKPDENTIPQDVAQLYQDVAQKEEPVLISSKGVNACPVKEEVVAPFWANNTRGEVLALLNLYPFEQYVHWEKCTQEHKQMYCRDGCRCEQQYRLHRLLAYDPHNECRGIFSDWFRFPSCCICKCYNIPFEYRVTSRSPRSMGKYFKNDEDESIAEDRMDDDIDNGGETEYEHDHSSNDWFHKKSHLNDDFSEMFNDDIEF